jgi:hypothetical protein
MGPAAIDLGDKRRRLIGVGQNEYLADGSRESHMEDAPLSLFVFAQTVREKSLRGTIEDNVLPLSTFDLVDCRQMHRWTFSWSSLESTTEPLFERGDIWVEGRH